MDFVNVNDREQSEFNMAVSYLNRLNFLFYICNESAMNLDGHRWLQTLSALFRELSTEMKETEIKLNRELLKDLMGENTKQMNNDGINNISRELYWRINDFELKLRRVVRESGLQMMMKQDASRAIEM